MKKILLPLIIALIGLGAGSGAGLYLRSNAAQSSDELGTGSVSELADPEHASATEVQTEPEQSGNETTDSEEQHGAETGDGETAGHSEAVASEFEYVKLAQQFVVPVLTETRVSALVVISLSLEVTPGSNELVYAKEPKLRDAFLRVMFTHAHSGGFDGSFTTGQGMQDFRNSLKEAAAKVLGDIVNEVLLTDIVRQDT